MKTTYLLAAALAASLVATPTMADRYKGYDRSSTRDYAKVLKVTPIYETAQISSPRRDCWVENTTTYVEQHRGSGGNVFMGGLIGGIIGHQFGKGRGKDAATAMGTLIGASIGAQKGYTTRIPRVSSTERCRVNHQYYSEERQSGYRVKYRYQGRVYHTRTDHHPGDRIRVRVTVEPAE